MAYLLINLIISENFTYIKANALLNDSLIEDLIIQK